MNRARNGIDGTHLHAPEIRRDIKTDEPRAINMHLLFSPDDPNHEREIERLLGQLQFEFNERVYLCTASQLTDLGRACNPPLRTTSRRSGPEQINLRRPVATSGGCFVMTNGCVITAWWAGSSNNGTSGLQSDDSYAATQKEIERFANIIFASTPKRGNSAPKEIIEETYGALKPCLHGSGRPSE
jgi:hypothetical protein